MANDNEESIAFAKRYDPEIPQQVIMEEFIQLRSRHQLSRDHVPQPLYQQIQSAERNILAMDNAPLMTVVGSIAGWRRLVMDAERLGR